MFIHISNLVIQYLEARSKKIVLSKHESHATKYKCKPSCSANFILYVVLKEVSAIAAVETPVGTVYSQFAPSSQVYCNVHESVPSRNRTYPDRHEKTKCAPSRRFVG